MSDIFCIKCGEPWDSYGITYAKGEGDLSREEASRFLRGEGCPSCAWGSICTTCRGGGKVTWRDCPTCTSRGFIFARRMTDHPDPVGRLWQYGYTGHADLPWTVLGETIPADILLNGPYNEMGSTTCQYAIIKCPACHNEGGDCPTCKGTGKYVDQRTPEQIDQSVHSLLDASDDEPISTMLRFVGDPIGGSECGE